MITPRSKYSRKASGPLLINLFFRSDHGYPDPKSGGYTGPEACGTIKSASVISSSYGYNEVTLSAAYEIRQCYEYMKLGLAGTTFLFSSRDYGVAGNGDTCCTNPSCAGGMYSTDSSGTFNPGFPASCPYITAVGATQIKPNVTFNATSPEQACETGIYSGGGFSNIFPLPKYQANAVASYYSTPRSPLHIHAIQQLPSRKGLLRHFRKWCQLCNWLRWPIITYLRDVLLGSNFRTDRNIDQRAANQRRQASCRLHQPSHLCQSLGL